MRLMVDLARHWQQGSVSLHAVAQREDLPEAYLEQLVAVLRKAGLVNAEGDPVVNCIREQDCGTRAVWVKLQSTIARALDGMTLADLTKEKVTVA